MLTKNSKIRVLENFYALDYIFFGKPVVQLEDVCCPNVLKEYISVKGALISTLIEMFGLINFSPSPLDEVVDNTKSLYKLARNSAKIARENCQKLVVNEKSRQKIKTEVKKLVENGEVDNIEETIQNKIREKAFSMAVDNLLIQRTISESSNYKRLNDWTGRIIEDAYKILRDNLVELAVQLV
jgi:phage-related tail protein